MGDHCKACNAPLIWAITKDGKRAPITRMPTADGNVLIWPSQGTVQARVFAGFALEELRAEGVPLRLNHFADCPKADAFKGAS